VKFEIQVPKKFVFYDSELEKFLTEFTTLCSKYKRSEVYAEDIVHDFIRLYDECIDEVKE